MSAWKPELEAIVGARHGGAADAVATRLRDLDRRFPNVPEILFQLGWNLEQSGKTEEAIGVYEKAVALGLQPNEHAGALGGLATCLLISGQAQRASEVLSTARTLFPEQREFEAYQALALGALGQKNQAIQQLLVLLAECSDDCGIAAHQRTLRHLGARLFGAQAT